jgi:hypothetical protein
MTPIESSIQEHVNRLLHDLDFPKFYKSYEWKGDTWKKGFPDLFCLEQEISHAAQQHSLGLCHLLEIAKWGKHPNPKKISWPGPNKLTLYINDLPASWLKAEPEKAISLIKGQIHGFGPTYASKLLHFAFPQIFGAIDTRLVRVFGKGDLDAQRYPLLNLSVKWSGERWAILSSQPGWAEEYGKWVGILNYIADSLNKDGKPCPHPQKYVQSGLRKKGIWLPADVETALFSYASQVISGKKD